MIALRSTAWIHAEILADADAVDRVILERRMAQGLRLAAHKALERWWLLEIPELDSSRLVAGVPLGFVNELSRLQMAGALAAVGAVGGAAVLWASRRRQQRVNAKIEILGAFVYRFTERAMNRELQIDDQQR